MDCEVSGPSNPLASHSHRFRRSPGASMSRALHFQEAACCLANAAKLTGSRPVIFFTASVTSPA